MREGIHPAYGPVAFRDRSTGDVVVTRSTLVGTRTLDRTVEVDGVTYPVVDVDVTSHSHPFWTGRARELDSEGRVERFRRRYGAGS
ncbi:type B 50S ribosomal protein L31 [Nocardioides sp. NPDC092400]|uniref:type B 50S ribosomal protein L31 n=1 Tax=Nocardioides sp. NPDC092400 TaxID=3155196 RepID=UPI00344508D4